MAVFAPSTTENRQASLKYWELSPWVTSCPLGKSCGLVSVCKLFSQRGGKKIKNRFVLGNCFSAQGIIVDSWYPTTQHCDLWETVSICYFLDSLLNFPALFPKLLIPQKCERPMGLNRRGGLSCFFSLLQSFHPCSLLGSKKGARSLFPLFYPAFGETHREALSLTFGSGLKVQGMFYPHHSTSLLNLSSSFQ